MPSNFHCRACGLQFIVGWSHDLGHETGYGATSRLVCNHCGTEHAIRVALRDRGPERVCYYDVTLESVADAMRVDVMKILRERFDMSLEEAKEALALLPLTIARRIGKPLAHELDELFSPVASLVVTEVVSEANPLHGPLQPDQFLSAGKPRFDVDETLEELAVIGQTVGPNKEFDLEVQPCAGCGAAGSFVADPIEVTRNCPHCGEEAIECLESWTT